MSLVFITGMPGSGKSTVQQELTRRGYEAYDSDEGFSSWRNKKTNELVQYPQSLKDRTHVWYAQNTWKIARKQVEELAARAKDKLIFLCGSPGNDGEVWDLFDKVICLIIDEKTTKFRITTRTNNDYGKAPDELEGILEWNKTYEQRYRSFGATIINATKPLEQVVDQILNSVKA